MSSSGSGDEVVYILVSINIHQVKAIESGQYCCDVLYYNSGTWCRGDNDTI